MPTLNTLTKENIRILYIDEYASTPSFNLRINKNQRIYSFEKVKDFKTGINKLKNEKFLVLIVNPKDTNRIKQPLQKLQDELHYLSIIIFSDNPEIAQKDFDFKNSVIFLNKKTVNEDSLLSQIQYIIEQKNFNFYIKKLNREFAKIINERTLELEEILKLSQQFTSIFNEDELFTIIFNSLKKIFDFDLALAIICLEEENRLYQCARGKLSHNCIKNAQRESLSIFKKLNNLKLDLSSFYIKTYHLREEEEKIIQEKTLKYKITAPFPILDGLIMLFSHKELSHSKISQNYLQAVAGLINSALQKIAYMKKAEKSKVEAIIENMHDGIVLLNDKSKITMVNPSAKRILQLTNAPFKIGTTLNKIGDCNIKELIDQLRNIHRISGQRNFLQKEINLKSEYDIILSLTASILKSNEIDSNQFILILRNITEEKKAQEQLFMTSKLASLGELAAGIAHEINNPITSVMGYAQFHLMQITDKDKELKEDLQRIFDEGKRVQNIVKSLLSFAREQEHEKKEMDLNKAVSEVLKLFGKQLALNNIKLILELSPNLSKIYGNPSQIQQVIINLIQNAFDAIQQSKKGSIIKLKTQSSGSDVQIIIEDDGPGIPENIKKQIFNPFFTTKPVGKGTGLGLSICHKIIEKHEGKILVKSKMNHGTTFVIQLPALKSQNDQCSDLLSIQNCQVEN